MSPASATVEYLEPSSLDDALSVLAELGDDATVVAGGTAIAIMLRQRLLHPVALVSLARLPEMREIEVGDAAVEIGALVTHREVELHAGVRRALPALAAAFAKVANVRVRCAATVGGVLAEADYASDPPCVLLAFDAEVLVRGPAGARTIPIADFFLGFYETALDDGELVVGVRVPLPPAGMRSVYEKFRTRSSEDRPCVGVAAAVLLGPDGRTCSDLRLAVGAASETPQRLPDVEGSARGVELTDEVIAKVAEAYADRADTLDDMRGSAWYRTEMVRLWATRAITAARDARR
jgi:carbon-monoxide dehydrogenase medium subunit